MKRILPVAAILLLAGVPAPAHRLDEYLQGAIISVEKHRVDVEMTLTPGVAVFPVLVADIDTDGNGVISADEQHSYVGRVLRDLSLKLDGQPLAPRLLSMEFPAIEEMKEGRGEIRIEFEADLPAGGSNRKLTLENHHQSRISAYQVNCLVSRDPGIRILSQNRNYTQSFYELDFAQAGAHWMAGAGKALGTLTLLLFTWLALLFYYHPFGPSRAAEAMWGRLPKPAADCQIGLPLPTETSPHQEYPVCGASNRGSVA